MRSAIFFVALVIAGAAAVPAGQGQRQGAPLPPVPPPTFRSSVNLVHLDVSVLDKDRRPVRGLKPADFTILEDGKPQQISVFQAVDIPDVETPATPWLRDVAPDVATNAGLQERRLFLLIVDDATLQSDLHAIRNLKDVGRRVIDRLGPSDLAAVVFTRNNRNSQDYTSDRARLLAALDKTTAGFRDMTGPGWAQMGLPNADEQYYWYSANVLESAVEVLSTMPDRRKVIVYIGQGMPIELGGSFDDLQALGPGTGLEARAPRVSGMVPQSFKSDRVKDQLVAAFRMAARANVNVYTMDVCGVRASMPQPTVGVPSGPTPTCEPGNEVEYLNLVAANTGGRAVVNTNDFEPGVKAVFEENASYYLLGYEPPRGADGKTRRLEVRVDRPGVEVRTRNGYTAEKASTIAKRKAASPLGVAISGVLPKSDLPLEATAIPFPIAGRRESSVAVVVGVRQPIRQANARAVERFEMMITAYDVEGKSHGATTARGDVTIRAGASGLAEYEVLAKIDLKPGRYQLRIAASVPSLSTSGSLYYDVDVPDLRAPALALSPLMLVAAPSLPVAPPDALKSLTPVVPTVRRSFGAGDKVSAILRAYQGGKQPLAAVPLRVRIQNERGETVMNSRQELATAQFAAERFANVAIDVPVARLPAGEYLLSVETGEGGALLRRVLRFSVRASPRPESTAPGRR